MADNTINIDLNIDSNIGGTTKDAEILSRHLESMRDSIIAYNRARAISSTSSRAFAQESEGLGGIVRSYAIIAANIYAVGSAFKVLSDAMDTTIMVKAMDLLGARSGVALGSLAKDLVKVSDGALSMREAMETVSKGTSAGITGNQLRDLTKVAGNASRALGISMPDAMSRLIRGASKLEPELLDELGIFTKIEPALNDYARSLGKSASSLTDFEKRQAFLVGILKEGADKYDGLEEAGTNAYTKLGAKLKDTLQDTLENVNKLLGPIVKFLSESPTALYTVLAGIAALLTRQILPAFTQFGASMKRGLNTASIEAIARVDTIQKAIADKTAKAHAQAEIDTKNLADQKQEIAGRAEKNLQSLKNRPYLLTPGVQEIVDKGTPATDITPERAKQLRGEIRQSGLPTQDRRVQYGYIRALEQARDAELAYANAVKIRGEAILAAQKASWTYTNELRTMNRAVQQSAASLNLANVAETTRNLGIREGLRTGMADIAKRRAGETTREIPTGQVDEKGNDITKTVKVPQLGMIGGAVERLKVRFTAATQAVSSFIEAWSPWLMLAGLLAPAFLALHDWAIGNVKDVEATNDAYDKLQGSIKAAYNTIEFLGKNSSKVLSVENLSAAATALRTIGDDLEDFTRKAQRELTTGSSSPWYQFVEGAQKLANFGTEKSISKAIIQSLDAAVELSVADSEPLRKKLLKILELPEDTTFEGIKLKLKQSDIDLQIKAGQALKQIGVEAQAAIQPTKDLLEAFTQTGKVFDNIITAVLPSSGLAKWAYDGLINMQNFRKEVGDVATDIGALNDIVKAPGNLIKKFGIEGSAAIIPLIPRIQELNKAYTENKNALADLDKIELKGIDQSIAQKKRYVDIYKELVSRDPSNAEAQKSLKKEEDNLAQALKMREEKIATSIKRQPLLGEQNKIEQDIKNIFDKFDEISAKSTKEFGEVFERELGNVAAKAQLSISKALTGYIQDPGIKAKLEFETTKQEISLEREKIQTTVNLIRAMELNRIEIAKNSNELAIKRIQEDKTISESERARQLSNTRIEAESLRLREAEMTPGSPAQKRARLQAAAEKTYVPTSSVAGGEGGLLQLDADSAAAKEAKQAAQRAYAATGPVLMSIQAAEGQSKQLDANLKSAEIRLQVEGGINDAYNSRQKALDRQLESLKLGRQEAELTATSEVDRLEKVNNIDKDILETEHKKKIVEADRVLAIQDYIASQFKAGTYEAALAQESARRASSVLENLKNQGTETARVALQEKNRAEALKRVEEKYKDITVAQQNQATLLEARRGLEDAGIQAAKERFEAEASLGKFTPQQLQDRRAQIALDEVNLNQTRQKENAEKSLRAKQSQLGTDLERALLKGDIPEQDRIRETMRITSEAYNINLEAINKLSDAKRENIKLTNSMSVQEKGFADIFTKGFESMADAMAEFVKTGKLDFKSLINSMIMDLIRFQLRSQMQELAGPGGFANLFAKALSGIINGKPTDTTGFDSLNSIKDFDWGQVPTPDTTPIVWTAKGGAFGTGIDKFAMGGAFTNSIVRSPTLFKFATGTGLMGEAGPEAIMPLKRDATGNLGVRSNQPKVDIVVNNYSGQKTETKETTDSRGNRKVEVVVGEMSASDISKPGSSSQQALRSNYGLQPALIRR